jgi:hypothetical protein
VNTFTAVTNRMDLTFVDEDETGTESVGGLAAELAECELNNWFFVSDRDDGPLLVIWYHLENAWEVAYHSL